MPPLTPAANAPAKAAAKLPIIPFVRAAIEHEEQFHDKSTQIDTSTHPNQVDVPAYGFIRGISLLVEATGGVDSGETVAVNEDAPWIALTDIALRDVNGAPIFGPVTGFDLYLINKYGGYRWQSDPRAMPEYSAPAVGSNASGNFTFMLNIPVELSLRDGLGSLANQNASSVYRLEYTVNTAASLYSTQPDTKPSMRVRAFLNAWSQPPTTDLRGNPQATTPPANNTVQYWSKFTTPILSGANTFRLPRVGNYIRNLIFYINATSDATRATGEAVWSDPCSVSWDTRLMRNLNAKRWKKTEVERYGYSGTVELVNGLDNAVRVYDFIHDFDGHVGSPEMRDGWLPTVQSTRLELAGSSFGAAGTLTVLTNDVAPAGNVFLD